MRSIFENLKLFSFVLLFTLGACVKDGDYKIPTLTLQEPDIEVNSSIEEVKGIYNGYQSILIGDRSGEKPLYLKGYVISDDEQGNFYKTLIIQDKPKNPKAGVSISTDLRDLYLYARPGRKIYFRVDGLFSGEYNGLPTLGTQGNGDGQVGRIGEIDFKNRILRSNKKDTLIPTTMSIDQISKEKLNTLVKFENMQFSSDLEGEYYASPTYRFSVNRSLKNCNGQEIDMRTSGYADFRAKLLPLGNGPVTAVLSAYNSDFQLFIRSPKDMDLKGNRCP